jgi:hypothetical protein
MGTVRFPKKFLKDISLLIKSFETCNLNIHEPSTTYLGPRYIQIKVKQYVYRPGQTLRFPGL